MLHILANRTYRHLLAAQVIALLGTGLATVALDLVRCVVALTLPFVTEVWQIYVLIFLLQSASATFTPTFQATIPDVLWPTSHPDVVPHSHSDLPADHPRLKEGHSGRTEHAFVIDDLHPAWPRQGSSVG